MIKIQDVVRDIIYSDEEALFALSRNFMNLSAYAKQIENIVTEKSKKNVGVAGIVVALSRVKKEIKMPDPLIQDIKINNITAKSPLTEIVYDKTPKLLARLSSLYEQAKMSNDDFLTMTLSTNEISVICSDRIKKEVSNHFKDKPRLTISGLASVGLTIDAKYYDVPNVTYSLLRRIAQKKIVLAETITTHGEIIFVFKEKNLPEILTLFRA